MDAALRTSATGYSLWASSSIRSTLHVPKTGAPPLRWVVPQKFESDGDAPARNRLLTGCDDFVAAPVVEVSQGGRALGRHRIWWSPAPGRVFRIPTSVLEGICKEDGDVSIALVGR